MAVNDEDYSPEVIELKKQDTFAPPKIPLLDVEDYTELKPEPVAEKNLENVEESKVENLNL